MMVDLSKVTKELEWKDISNEAFRTYYFPSYGYGISMITIDKPVRLNYNPKSGGHRVIDSEGGSWYIPSGWIALYWEGHKEGVAQYDF